MRFAVFTLQSYGFISKYKLTKLIENESNLVLTVYNLFYLNYEKR